MAEYLGQAVLDVAVAPGRVAYLIHEGSRDGFRRAVQETCTRWAGQTEPIFPVASGGVVADWWLQVVRLAGVEATINVDVPEDEAVVVASALGLPLLSLVHIDQQWTASAFTVHPSAIDSTPNPAQAYIIAEQNAPLWQVTVAGDLTDEHFAALTPPIASFRRPSPFPVQRVRAENEIASAQLRNATLLDRTVAYFGECWASGGPSSFPALVWVTDGDDLADCLWFWNLRALRPLRFESVPMVLLPTGAVEHWMGYAAQFTSTLARPEGFSPDAIIGSHTANEDQIQQIAMLLGLRRSIEEVRSGHKYPALLREAPYTYLTYADMARAGLEYRPWLVFRRRYGESTQMLTQLFRNETVIRFLSPVPFIGDGYAKVRLSGGPFGALPRRPSTAALIKEGATWHGDVLQLSTDARREYDMRVRVPRMVDVVGVVLSEAVEQYELSDKGKIGTALQASRDIAVLLHDGAYEAVLELTTPRAEQLRRELRKLHTDGVTLDLPVVDQLVAEWGHRGERRYRSGRQFSKLGRVALETLVDQRWAERGFEISCTDCGVSTFVPMTDVPTRGPAVCSGCRSPQRYTAAEAAAPTTFYRLDGLIDRASDQGVLPHLLAIAALTAQDPDCSLLPGTDLIFPDGDDPEVDIFGVHQARVLAGEVKTKAAAFTAEQLARDVKLSRRLRADVHLLAAIDTVSAEIETTARELCRDAGLELLVLSQPQLRPNNPGTLES